jgi:signal transduction histidine kinase
MHDADDRVIGLVAVGRDLTERRQFEAQLLQSEKLAALGVMAGGIAHEIRNPLAVVSSAAQLLLEKSLVPKVQQECAERIYRNVQRVANIIENLLRFARPSDKGVMKSLDLVPVVQEALALLANQVKLAKIELVTNYPPTPLRLRGNAGLLQQLLTNLLLNALTATSLNGGVIHLALAKIANEAVIQVSDSGHGIQPDNLSKVFDPFFTTRPVGQGTGLGLSISYAIVQQHEGKITITSQPDIGTTVTVRLPLEKENDHT